MSKPKSEGLVSIKDILEQQKELLKAMHKSQPEPESKRRFRWATHLLFGNGDTQTRLECARLTDIEKDQVVAEFELTDWQKPYDPDHGG